MKPVIGITPSIHSDERGYIVHRAHCDAIRGAGGIPIIIPYEAGESVQVIAEELDGLYLTGGDDIDPHYFNEEPHLALGRIDPLRDEFEIELIHEMSVLHKPILGICRGSQILNVAFGGTMYQDIFTQKDAALIQHKQNRPLRYGSHFVEVNKQSLLYDIVKNERIKVNSNHHQANKELGKGLQLAATSDDGIIEAVEGGGETFLLGVQWHPERMLTNEVSRAIYSYFIKMSKRNKNESL